MKIRTKLTAILVLVAMAGIILSAFIYYVVARKEIIEKIEGHLESVAVLKGDRLKKYVEERIGNLDHMTRGQLYREIFLGASKQKIRGVLKETLAHKKELIELFTLNLDGVVDVSTDERQEGKIKTYEKYFIEGKKGPFFQSLYYDLSLQVPSMTISAPIRDEQGRLSGLLVGRVNLKRISSLMTDRTGLGKTGETYLVNMSNFMVTESRFQKGLALNKFVSTEGVRDCLKGNSGHRGYVNYMGTPVLGYYEWIPETRACLLAEISQKQAFASIDRLRNILAFVTIGVVILVIILGFFFSKTISRPLEKLIMGTERIGKGDLEHRVDVRSKDEIGKLALAFNHMTERRQETEEALKEARDELEQRVEERTSELVRKIEEHKQAEEMLRESQSLLNAVGKMGKIGGWEFDVETLEQLWTEEVYRIHEVDLDYNPTVGKGIDFYAPESRPIIEQAVQRAIDDGEPFDVELRFITAKGNHLWVHALGQAHQKNGKTTKVWGVFQDITEKKLAEEALRESEERFRILFESSKDAIYITTPEGNIVEANPSHFDLFGYSREKISDWNAQDTYVNPDDRSRFRKEIEENGSVKDFEVKLRKKDGTEMDCLITATVRRSREGSIVGYQGIIRDITEAKLTEEALRESEEKY
ncbi:MAG: PAS domain S-box protein, partial [Pseudomonadota bacterium]